MFTRARAIGKLAALAVAALGLVPLAASAGQLEWQGSDWSLTVSGYARQYLSMNLQNPPETKANDRYNLSMVRTVLEPYFDGHVSAVHYHLVGRIAREPTTTYLQRLETPSDLVSGGAGTGGANGGSNLVHDQYDVNDIREAWLGFHVGQWTEVRLGKQQIVFGHTDFFHALDMVEGYDFTWRSFLVPENEDVRKPLNLVNVMVNTAQGGQFQLVVIPGDANRKRDIGNTYDLFGGRWANQPNKGIDFLQVMDYNYDHPEGKASDTTGALRWSGIAGDISYSVDYLHVYNPDPVVNSVFAPWKAAPRGLLGDFIYPVVDTVGGSMSAYSSWADAVFSTEVAYTLDKPYNVGTNGATCGSPFPGFCGVKQKNTVNFMVRMDKNVSWTHTLLGAARGSFMSFQFFDTWIPNFKKSDDIVDLAGYAAPKHEHNMIATGILGLSYMNARINPQLAGDYDLTNGGGFLIPSVQFVRGDHWRLKVEADLFYPHGSNEFGGTSSDTHLFGYFANNAQLALRLSYLF